MKKKVIKILAAVLAVAAVCVGSVYVYLLYHLKGHQPKASSSKINVACIGDSITDGVGVLFHFRDAYPALLQKELGSDYKVLNYGVLGTTAQTEGDDPYVKTKRYKTSIESNADIVLIMLGTNDSKPVNWNTERYEEDLTEMVNTYKNLASKPVVYLMTCAESGENDVGIRNEVVRDEVNVIIRKVAENTGCEVIDIYAVTEGHPEYYSIDTIHPNEVGNQAIAEAVAEIIQR